MNNKRKGTTKKGIKKLQKLYREGWIYAGGNFEHHTRHWDRFVIDYELEKMIDTVPIKSNCICGHEIKESRNCYLYKEIGFRKHIRVLGCKCIKGFEYNFCKRCFICNEPHKNTSVNRCNKHRHL